MRKRIPILIVGTITLLFLGLIYGYSVVMAPLKAQFDWSVSGMTVIFALSMISFTIGNLVAGKLLKRHNVRFVMTVAIAFLLVGFIGSALVDGAASLPAVWCTYGVIASVGIGFVYNVIVPTITAWYPDKTGMAQGVCLMGYGLGGFVLGPVLTQLYTVMDWRIVFVAMAVIFSGLVFASSIVIHMPSPEEAAQLPASKAVGDNAGNAAGTKDVPTHELFRDPTFYFFYLWMFLLGAVGMATTGIGREFPTSLGADAVTAAFVIGFVNIGSGLGRLVGGTLLDRIGRAPFMVGTACLSVAGALIMLAAQVTGSIPIQIAGCLVTGLAWGAVIVTMDFVVRKVWGQTNFAENLAVVNSYGIFAALVGSMGSGVLVQAVGSLATVLVVMACFGVLGLADSLILNAHRSKVARLKLAKAGAKAE